MATFLRAAHVMTVFTCADRSAAACAAPTAGRSGGGGVGGGCKGREMGRAGQGEGELGLGVCI